MVAICAATTLGFSPSDRAFVQPSPLKKCQSLSSTHHPLFAVSGDENGDFPSDESTEYSGSVDWDAEWKKVGVSHSFRLSSQSSTLFLTTQHFEIDGFIPCANEIFDVTLFLLVQRW